MTLPKQFSSEPAAKSAQEAGGCSAERMADCVRFMPAPKKIWIIAAFAALYVIWGSTYLGIRFAIETIPPFLMAGTRFFLAGLIMYAIARAQDARRSTWAEWRGGVSLRAWFFFVRDG